MGQILLALRVMKYSEPRFTKDLDVFIATDQDNANGVYTALKEFGAPLENLTHKIHCSLH